MKSAHNRTTRLSPLAAALASILLFPGTLLAGSSVYTTTSDFALGALQGVTASAVPNQLQLSDQGSTFPLLWVANAGENTLSKIDTVNNVEVARYRTFFSEGNHGAWDHAAPSRSAVDTQGNAYILNRQFVSGRPASVMKILASGGINRNGNAFIDTSACPASGCVLGNPAHVFPLVDSNGNHKVDAGEIQDERIAWSAEVGPANGVGRALCIGKDGNLWVGLYSAQQFWKISAADGSTLAGPIAVPWTPYGCAVDANGTIWSASITTTLGRITTPDTTPVVASYDSSDTNYGIALGNGKVYTASYGGYRSFRQYDPATNSFSWPASSNHRSLGISVDGNNDIVIDRYQYGVAKYGANGAQKAISPNMYVSDTRGAIVDSNNDVWHINLGNNTVDKFHDNGAGSMTHVVRLPVGLLPYTYSDASGIAALTQTTRTGNWDLMKDSGANGTVWNKIAWTASTPTNTTLTIKARSYDNPANLQHVPWFTPTNGAAMTMTGRYIEVLATFTGEQGATPVLNDLTVFNQDIIANKCDVNSDDSINRTDILAISAANGQTATGPSDPRDANNDTRINILDVRACTLRCTKPLCAL